MEEKEVFLFVDSETLEGIEAEKLLKDAGIVFTLIPTEGVAPMVTWGVHRFGGNSRGYVKDFVEVFLKEREELREAKTTFEEREARRKNAHAYLEELYRQLERIFDAEKGYLPYTGKHKKQFMEDYITPLTEAIHAARNLPDFDKVKLAGNMPLVLVLPRRIVSLGAQVHRIEIDGENGDPFPFVSSRFNDVINRERSHPLPYLLIDVNDGGSTLNATPREAASSLKSLGRMTLDIEEGLGLLTHFPDTLKILRMLLGIVAIRVGEETVEGVPFFYADRRTATFSVMHAVEGRDISWGTASYGMRVLPEEVVEAICVATDQGTGGTSCNGCGYLFEGGSWEQMVKLMEDRLAGRMNRCPGCKKKVRFVGP
jgi:hypothetical protein